MQKLIKLLFFCIAFFSLHTVYAQPTVLPGFTIRTVATGGILAGQILDGVVASPITGEVFVAGVTSTNSSSFNLYKITRAGVVSLIANYPFAHTEIVRMALGPDGMIYTGDGNSGTIKKINPATGASSTYAPGFSSGSRYGLNFDPAGNLIIAYESLFDFFRVTPTGMVSLGHVTATVPDGNHGDAFGIQPDGSYVVYSDNCGLHKNPYSINTTGHVAGTPYTTLNWYGSTDLATIYNPSNTTGTMCGYSNGGVDPETGDVYSITSNFGKGITSIAYTPAIGGASSAFVTGAGNGGTGDGSTQEGIIDIGFGLESGVGTCSSLYFVDRFANKVYEIPLHNCCTPKPAAVTVAGSGSFCGNATITASGGTGGTIYFQGTTNNGTSTANPSSSEVITSSGTYYFRALGPTGCWGQQGSASISISPRPNAPVISATGNISQCAGNLSSVTLTVPAVAFSAPITYNIPFANLVNLPNNCSAGGYYGSGFVGFNWNDIGNGIATNVQVKFSVGVECSAGAHTSTFNSVAAPAFSTTASCTCSPRSTSQIITLNFSPTNYIGGGANQFLMSANTFGLVPDASLGNNYAQVTVTYGPPPLVWSPGGATTNSITVSPLTTTTYTVTVTGGNGCSNSSSQTITVGSSPVITCPGNMIVNTDANQCSAVVNYNVPASGTPSPTLTYSFSGATTGSGSGTGSGSVFNKGNTTVTVTATNNCGMQSCNFTVTVNDITNPTITCPVDVSVQCATEIPNVDIEQVNASDNCPLGLTITWEGDVISNQTCANRYTITRTYKATDASGNFATCTQTITVNDNTAPVITCPSNITVNNTAGQCGAIVNFTATATDNCAGAVTITYSKDPGTFFIVGTTFVTATATDVCGNSSTCMFTVTVVDNIAPVITCNASIEVCGAQTVNYTIPTATDNCSVVVTQTSGLASGSVFPVGTTVNTYTATDPTGNSVSCSFSVIVNPVPDVATIANQTVCNNATTAAINFTGSVSGTTFSWTNNNTSIGLSSSGTGNINSFTATNITNAPITATVMVTPTTTTASLSCSGTAKTFTITVNPTAVVNPVANKVICYGASTGTTIFSSPTTGGTIRYNWTNNTPAIGLAASGVGNLPNFVAKNTTNAPLVATITVTASFAVAGNCVSTAKTFTITVNPTPNFDNAQYFSGVLSATDPVYARPEDYIQGGTCVVSVNTVAGTAVHYKTHSFTLTQPSNVVVSLLNSDGGLIEPTGNNINIDPFLQLVGPGGFNPASPCTNSIAANDDAGFLPQGRLTRIATTTALPAGTYTVVVTTWDNSPGTFSNTDLPLPWNYTLAVLTTSQTVCNGNATTALNFNTTVPGTIFNWTNNNTSIGLAANGTGSIPSFTATNSGNTAVTATVTVIPAYTNAGVTCTGAPVRYFITVNPTPTITCPGNQTVNHIAGTCSAIVNYSSSATGAPAPTISYSFSGATVGTGSGNGSGSLFNVGTTTVTLTATNDCGVKTCSFTVNVIDAEPPVITCPANIILNCQDDNTSAATGVATATDNCAIASITQMQTSTQTATGVSYYNYVISRTWTATDVNGNSSTCLQTITVQDVTAPVITCPTNITINCQDDNTSTATGVATGLDNCSPVTISETQTSSQTATGASHYNYVISRTWKATDESNNSSTCLQTITVQDVTAPVIICPTNITVNCQDDNTSTATGVATGSDNCSPVTISETQTSSQTATGASHYNYVISRTWKATDESGNFSTCLQTITVQDVTAPVITCPASVTVNCQDNNTSSSTGVATGTDNCSPVTITQSDASTYNASLTSVNHYNYIITRTWRATDVAGNFSECLQTITVQDVTAPIITCPASVTLNCQDNNTSSSTGVATGTDNCSPVTISQTQTSSQTLTGASHYNYVITRIWKANDVSGNFSTCVQTITVQDVTAPVITCPANVTVNCQANNTSTATGVATGTDNCSPVTITQSQTSTQSSNPNTAGYYNYVITRTWKATDVTGNVSTCVQTITVRDVTAPTFTAPANITIYTNSSCGYNAAISVTGDVTNETDNCATGLNATYTDVTVNGSCQGSKVITRTWRLVDYSGNAAADQIQSITVSDNSVPTFTRPADIIIPFTSTTCGYNIAVSNTGDVINEADNCSTGLQATFTDLVSQCGYNTVIKRTWKLVDNCGNAAANQVQTITVTDNNTDYIIYAANEAKFGENNFINGDVGVTAANGKAEFKKGDVLNPYKVKAKNIVVQLPSQVTNRFYTPATGGPNPSFYPYNGTGGSGNYTATTNGTVNGNYKNLTIKSGVIATVTGNDFGKITVEENAKVTFTSSLINMEELEVEEGENSGTSNVNFSGCTAVKVKKKVSIEENCRVNVNGPKVTFYMGDNSNDEEEFKVEGGNTQVTLNIMIPKGKLKVDGDDEGSSSTIMTGWFIIDKINGEGKNVTWNKYSCATSFARGEESSYYVRTKPKVIVVPVEKAEVTSTADQFKVTIYPNPTVGDFNIKVISSSTEPVMMKIMDVNGIVVQQATRVTKQGYIGITNRLAGGTYFVEVTQGNNRQVVKLIKLN